MNIGVEGGNSSEVEAQKFERQTKFTESNSQLESAEFTKSALMSKKEAFAGIMRDLE